MKKYIKDNKIYALPIEILLDNKRIWTTDQKLILENGFDQYIDPDIKPTLQQLIKKSDQTINQETDNKILSEFEWHGMKFWLSLENQMNFLVLYNQRQNMQLKVKHQNGFYTFESPAEYEDFYLSAVHFVKKCIQTGWQRKTVAQQEIYLQYMNENNN